MTEDPNRRDFLKAVAFAGAGAVVGGAAGFAIRGASSEAPAEALQVHVDEDGIIVLEGPAFRAAVDSVLSRQDDAVQTGRSAEYTVQMRYEDSRAAWRPPVNIVCGCDRGLWVPEPKDTIPSPK